MADRDVDDRDRRVHALMSRAAWADDPSYTDAHLQQIPEVIRDKKLGHSSPPCTITSLAADKLQRAARHFLFAEASRVGTPRLSEEHEQYLILLNLLANLQSFLDTWDRSARERFVERVITTAIMPWRSWRDASALRKGLTTFDHLVQGMTRTVEVVVPPLPPLQHGRPPDMDLVREFIIELADIYKQITGRKAGLSRTTQGKHSGPAVSQASKHSGPFLRFVIHCLQPIAPELVKDGLGSTVGSALAERRKRPSSHL